MQRHNWAAQRSLEEPVEVGHVEAPPRRSASGGAFDQRERVKGGETEEPRPDLSLPRGAENEERKWMLVEIVTSQTLPADTVSGKELTGLHLQDD